MSFADKVVLVTGGSSGIGAAIAVQFSQHGAKVAIIGRNQVKLQKVAARCEEVGSAPLVVLADVSRDEDVRRALADTLQRFGKLDVLVNNAGISVGASILAADAIHTFDRVMSTNLRGPVLLTNLAAPHLIATRGNVINISSITSQMVISRDVFAYSASKAALDHFSRCVALELAPKGVRVNCINPGPVITDIAVNSGLVTEENSPAMWEQAKNFTPLHRVSEPEEVAELALFLASERARSITGAAYVIDNGMLLAGNIGS